jgi:hypothetical protein
MLVVKTKEKCLEDVIEIRLTSYIVVPDEVAEIADEN